MDSRELKVSFRKQELASFLKILIRIKKVPIKGASPKDELALSYSQLDESTKEEIQGITYDVTEAITDSGLRDELIEYSEKKLSIK